MKNPAGERAGHDLSQRLAAGKHEKHIWEVYNGTLSFCNNRLEISQTR
jgi:hypothetical protein